MQEVNAPRAWDPDRRPTYFWNIGDLNSYDFRKLGWVIDTTYEGTVDPLGLRDSAIDRLILVF